MKYTVNTDFFVNCGFDVKTTDVVDAINLTNEILSDLPASLYKSIDFKTTSAMVGSIFCESLASRIDGMVNPIEKGHPDIVPYSAKGASEAQLRNFPQGLEIKATIGNIETGANLRAGIRRIEKLTGITWQAHHQEVENLLGITWDFANQKNSFNYPAVTGAFYGRDLSKDDWGKVSGTTGRNTKVSGMKSSGKSKMGKGWIAVLDETEYKLAFTHYLKTSDDAS